MNAFSVATLGVAAAALGCLGFAESARLLGWPVWACWLVAGIALIAGFVAFMPNATRQPPRRVSKKLRRRRHTSPASAPPPISEIPLPPVEPLPVADISASPAEPPVLQSAPVAKRKPSPRRRKSPSRAGEVVDLAAARNRRSKAKGEAKNG
jgi:hypothetical protein